MSAETESKYTLVWMQDFYRVSNPKMTRFHNTSIEKIMGSDYGRQAQYVFVGWPLLVGQVEGELESEPVQL